MHMVVIQKMETFANYQMNILDKVRYGSNGARFIIMLISALCGMTLLSLVYINGASNLEAQNNILREECDIVRVKNSDLSVHQSNTLHDLREKSSQLKTKEEQLTELQAAKVLIQGRLDKAIREEKKCLHSSEADQLKIKDLQDNNHHLKSQVAQMESQHRKLNETISQNEEYLQNYRETSEQQKDDYQKLLQLVTDLQQQLATLSKDNEALSKQNKEAKEQVKSIQAAVETAKETDKQVVNPGTNLISQQLTNSIQTYNGETIAPQDYSNQDNQTFKRILDNFNNSKFQVGNSKKVPEDNSNTVNETQNSTDEDAVWESDLITNKISLAPLYKPTLSQTHDNVQDDTDAGELKQAPKLPHFYLATDQQEIIDTSFQETDDNKLIAEDGIQINSNFNPREPLVKKENYLPDQGEISDVIDSNPASAVAGGSDLSETDEQHYRDDDNKDTDLFFGDEQEGDRDIENNAQVIDTEIIPENGIEVGENANEIKEFVKPQVEYDYKDNLNSDLDNMATEHDFDVIVGDEDYNTDS